MLNFYFVLTETHQKSVLFFRIIYCIRFTLLNIKSTYYINTGDLLTQIPLGMLISTQLLHTIIKVISAFTNTLHFMRNIIKSRSLT